MVLTSEQENRLHEIELARKGNLKSLQRDKLNLECTLGAMKLAKNDNEIRSRLLDFMNVALKQ